ncbi:MAG: SapC family protein [Piscinibacter sp.]
MSPLSALYRAPQPLDPVRHGALRIGTLNDWSIAARMHAVFVAVDEWPEAALEFPILFVHSGELDGDGLPVITPVALLGLAQGENLSVAGTRWRARWLPAFIRRYPFVGGRDGVLIDEAWAGLSTVEGEPLFDARGGAAPVLQRALEQLERFDAAARRTRGFCARLAALDLFKPMQADATLPDGRTLSVEGFRVVDEERLQALPDGEVLALHREGLLRAIHLHLASLATMPALIERKARRERCQSTGAHDGPP